MQFATKEAADEFDRRLKVLRRAIAMAANKPRVRTTEELGVENTAGIPPGSRPADPTALVKIREMAASLAPEATKQWQEQMRAKQLADAEIMASSSVGLRMTPELAAEIEKLKAQTAGTGWGDANRVSEAVKRQANDRQVGNSHYKNMDIQPWEAMEAWLTPEEFRGFLVGNSLKYLARAGKKGPYEEDIRKAHHYLEKLLEVL